MLSCHDRSPYSAANPLPAPIRELEIPLPDDSMRSRQVFDIEVGLRAWKVIF
jgi:hypothetical protein